MSYQLAIKDRYHGKDSKTFLKKGYYFLSHTLSFFSKNF